MARLTILLALLAALLLVAHASARLHHQQQQSSCDSIMESVDLSPCENYITERIQQDEEEDEEEEDVLSIPMRKRNGHRRMRRVFNRSPDFKSECCEELSEFKKLFGGRTRCMCRAQREMMQSLKEKLDSRSEVEQLKGELYRLPHACGIPLIERIGCPLDD